MLILVINCGSSSAKYQLLDAARRRVLAKGIVERIGQGGSSFSYHTEDRVVKKDLVCRNHYEAINLIVRQLTNAHDGVIRSRHEIGGVGHRVVHGGEEFKKSALITAKVIKYIERYSELAPLHNPPSLSGIEACLKILKGVGQVAVFDTSFHQTMQPVAFLYGLPLKYYQKYGIRRYGFHGTSHRFIAHEAAKVLGRPLLRLKLITCHLGNGCSMTAVRGGKSVDTSMGFTPLEGLMMGTRSGDLDPAVVFYMMKKDHLTPDRISDILNKESGLEGVSGVSNDMRDLVKCSGGVGADARLCKLAIEMFIYRIKKYIGSYLAAMGGLDAVIFTAGIGENCPWLVSRIAREMKRVVPGGARFLTIPTDEELLIAKDTYEIVKKVTRSQ
jgi:acetate kinase